MTDVDNFEPGIQFQTPPSKSLDFQVPASKLWESWAEELTEHPNQWAKYPLQEGDSPVVIKKNLSKISGMETLLEDGSLYARFRPTRTASNPSSSLYGGSQPQALPYPSARPVLAQERIERIEGMPSSLYEPAVTPLEPEDGINKLLENPPGRIFGE